MQQDNPNLGGKVAIHLAVDISEFYESVEWDIMNLTAIRSDKKYRCCTEKFPGDAFQVSISLFAAFSTLRCLSRFRSHLQV